MTVSEAQTKLTALDALNYSPAVKSYEIDGEKITFNSPSDFLEYRNFLVRIINSASAKTPFARIDVTRSNPPY